MSDLVTVLETLLKCIAPNEMRELPSGFAPRAHTEWPNTIVQ